jgi:FtsZ-interacting cell division protein ZipA
MNAQRPPSPILGSFEDIAKDVRQEVTQLPKDIVGSALESVGMGIGGKQKQQTPTPGTTQEPNSAWQQIDSQNEEKNKLIIARKALEELTQPTPKQKEPSEWDKQQEEEKQKTEMEEQRKEQEKANQIVMLPSSGTRKVPGLKSAITSKQSSELGKNTRSD